MSVARAGAAVSRERPNDAEHAEGNNHGYATDRNHLLRVKFRINAAGTIRAIAGRRTARQIIVVVIPWPTKLVLFVRTGLRLYFPTIASKIIPAGYLVS